MKFNPSDLRTKEAVFEEAKRVAAIKRWAHLGGLFHYAKRMFKVTAEEFVEKADLEIVPVTLERYARVAMAIYFNLPMASRKHTHITDCTMAFTWIRQRDLPFTRTNVMKAMRAVRSRGLTRHQLEVYFSAVGSLARALQEDRTLIDDFDDVWVARRYDESTRLEDWMTEIINRRWKWDKKIEKYVPRRKKSA